jgi:UDP-3-O-[3-hydroxymyristoyl] glucosamine N-acyltransferase
MKIKADKILQWLKNNKISYKLTGIPKTDYTIASIFNPVDNGFYFLVGNNWPLKVKKSLILSNFELENYEENAVILIKENSQEIFYKLINHFFSEKSTGKIQNTAVIHPEAEIGKNVQIDNFCVIGRCKIGDNVIIRDHCIIEDNTQIGKNSVIDSHSVIGTRGMAWVWDSENDGRIILPQLGGVKIGEKSILGAHTTVVRGSLNEDTIIGNHVLMAPGCKIGHGTQIKDFVHLANNIATGGNTVIGSYSFIGSGVTFRPKTKIHPHTIVGAGAVVVKNTSRENLTLVGIPAKEILTKSNPSGMPKPKN